MLNRSQPALQIAATAVTRLENPLFLILAAATGYYTYRGCTAIEQAADWEAKAGYGLFSFAVATGIYLGWRAVQSQVPLLSSRRRLLLAAPIVALICLFAVGVSSFYNLAGMVGKEALVRHMEVTIEQSSDSLAIARNQAHAGLEKGSVLRLVQTKFRELALSERTFGATSGVVGSGALGSMLDQVATVVGAANEDVERKIALADKLTVDSERHLEAMRGALNDPTLSLPIKTQRFGIEAEALRLALLELSRQEAGSNVRELKAAARDLITPALSANSVVADRQRVAIEGLLKQLDQMSSLAEVANEKRADPFLGEPYQAITVYTAVLQHLTDFIPAALAALLVDILPLPLLLLKILVYREINRDDDDLSSARRYTVAEMLEVRELMAELGIAPSASPIARRMPVINVVPNHIG